MNVRLTHEDMMIFRAHTSVETHARLLKADRQDADVMRVRTVAASIRGAAPAAIQRNVQAFETEDPRDCLPRVGAEAWKGPPSQRDDCGPLAEDD